MHELILIYKFKKLLKDSIKYISFCQYWNNQNNQITLNYNK